jgi:hypothetical protein
LRTSGWALLLYALREEKRLMPLLTKIAKGNIGKLPWGPEGQSGRRIACHIHPDFA